MVSELTMKQIQFDTSPRIEVAFETDRISPSRNKPSVSTIAASKTVSFESIKESIQHSKHEKLVDMTLSGLYETISLDKDFLIEEGVELPNEKAINYASLLIRELGSKKISPTRVSTLIEEGICITFKNDVKSMFFEIYNDGEVGFIVQDSVAKKVLENKDCYSLSEALQNIERFYF